MSTIVKETEVSSGGPDPLSARPTTTAASSETVKAQPVALEVSVTVNGARTLDGGEKREPFSESTKTVLVFGNGAVIRLQASVAPGQLLFLTNEKTKKEVVCQVVKSKNYRNVSGYVELEFTEPVVGFWGMRFPNDRAVATASPVANAPTPVNSAPAAGSPAAPVALAPAPPSSATPVSAPSRNPSAVPAPTSVAQPPLTQQSLAQESVTRAETSQSSAQSSAGTPHVAPPADVKAPAPTPANVTPISPFVPKSSGSTSSSASSSVLPSSSVLSLPRAAQPKNAASTHFNITPPPPPKISAVPGVAEPPARVAEKPAASKTAEESATEALKAENARLQEKLAALLSPDTAKTGAKKTEAPEVAARITAAPRADGKAAETAGKAPESAHLDMAPPVPAKNIYTPPVIAPIGAPIASVPAPPAASVKPVTPAKISTLPLPAVPKEEQIKIPSWLEPLARNAAISAPTEDSSEDAAVAQPVAGSNAVFEEPVPDAHWLNKLVSHAEPSQIAQRSDAPGQDLLHDELSGAEVFQQDNAEDNAQSNEQEYGNIAAPTFGSRLLLGETEASEEGAAKSRKPLIAAIAATILLAAGGGYWYTHQGTATPAVSQRAAQRSQAAQQSSEAPASVLASSEPQHGVANTPAAARPAGAIINQAATPAALNTNMVVTPSHASQPPSSSPVSTAANSAQPLASPAAAVQPKRPTLGEVHLAAPMVAHADNAGTATDADPSIGLNGSAAPAVTNLGEELAPSSGPAAPKAPIPVGGDVKSAKLLKSVPPIYPPFARTQRVGGDVKIDALIDATGRVTTMKAVSGPTLLHQAAMDALRQWKYQPATLDGKSVSMHLTVTIQFRLQ